MKGTWRLIDGLILNKQTHKSVSSILIDDTEVKDDFSIAQHFNDYFCNIAASLNSNISPPLCDPVNNININLMHSIYLSPVSPSEIVDIGTSLKNSFYAVSYTHLTLPTKRIV